MISLRRQTSSSFQVKSSVMAPQELPRRTLDDGTQKMKHRETISTELNFEPFSFAKNTAKESITTRKRCSKEKNKKKQLEFCV